MYYPIATELLIVSPKFSNKKKTRVESGLLNLYIYLSSIENEK